MLLPDIALPGNFLWRTSREKLFVQLFIVFGLDEVSRVSPKVVA